MSGEGRSRTPDEPTPAWHVVSDADLLDALRRCEAGESADLVYAEMWANAEHERVEGDQ